jgi:hypothetical protein
MENVYAGLLRSGTGTTKRHYELTGKLADAAAAQDPEQAALQRALLAAPGAAAIEGEGEAAAATAPMPAAAAAAVAAAAAALAAPAAGAPAAPPAKP